MFGLLWDGYSFPSFSFWEWCNLRRSDVETSPSIECSSRESHGSCHIMWPVYSLHGKDELNHLYLHTDPKDWEKKLPPSAPGTPFKYLPSKPIQLTIWKNSMVVAGSRRITIQPDSLCLGNIVRNSIACKLSTSHLSGLESQVCFLSGKFNIKKKISVCRYVSYTMEERVRILAFNICIRSARRVILHLTSL